MENASKALIIAGAILIAIVLVTVGVAVLSNFSPDEAISYQDQQKIDTFNSKFTTNAGSNVRGNIVRQLLQSVITSNANNEASKVIKVTVDSKNEKSAANDISVIINSINTQHMYTVTLSYSTDGYVNQVDIADNND